jgi:ATP-binding cassette, subfamily F, member 3
VLQSEVRKASNAPSLDAQPENGNGSVPQSQATPTRQRRLNPIKRKEMQQRCRQVEEEIARLEAGIAHCETALQTYVDSEETLRLTRELKGHRSELENLMAEWEGLAQALHN